MKMLALKKWQKSAARKRDLQFARAIFKAFPESQVYLVGGVVRDLLLGRSSKDLDFVVTGVPEKKLMTLLRKHGRVDLVGRTFGVLKFTPKGRRGTKAIDIALPRIDESGGSGAYRDVRAKYRHDVPIEQDLERRDFTVNALAWNMRSSALVDTNNGIADLQKKRLKTVGRAEVRFTEDYSRILRGLRFACQLHFEFEPKTWRAMRQLTPRLNKKTKGEFIVPRETIAKELLKAFYEDPSKALALYDKSGAMKILLPELLAMKKCPQPKPFHSEGDVWRHTEIALASLTTKSFKRRYKERPDAELIIATLLHDVGKPVTLRTPKKDKVNRIRFDGHDMAGAKIAHDIIERLKLASEPGDSPLHVDADNVYWMIKHHLLLLHEGVKAMRLTTVERYFVKHKVSHKLRALILADGMAAIDAKGKGYTKHIAALDRVLKKLSGARRKKLPKPLLTGDEIMQALNMAEGPMIGRLLRQLREQQLLGSVKTKRQAIGYLKRV